ncbi:hypothetical protein [Methylobacterium flocculans]|uniref:hypothetical protein n=1 Tax=Methylobacterium flocculans TaxID=2984843 RepID=UPI0021F3635A|nr:hypothetical protein [Methylobacterium sp. FF17]
MPAPGVYTSARTITPGTSVSSGSGVGIACSAAGIVNLVLHDGSIYPVYATVGQGQIDNVAVRDVQAGGTTATAIVTVLG